MSDEAPKKTALLFGHSSGLGYALSKVLIKEGFSVIGISRRNSDLQSPHLINLQADLSDEAQIQQLCQQIQNDYPSFSVLIFAAGALTAHSIDNFVYKELERVYKVNTFAPMVIESSLLDIIKDNSADVVNITSSSLIDYYPAFAEYSSSKAAFAKFTLDLRKELKTTQCRVMDICPGGFTSNIYQAMTGDKMERDESRQMKAEDLAELIVYLLKLPKRMEVANIFIDRK